MKKIITGIATILLFYNVKAQSVDVGNEQLYYHRYQSAINTFEQVIKQQPENAGAWYGLTHALLATGDVNAAVTRLQQAPSNVLLNNWLLIAKGEAALANKNLAEANQVFEQVQTASRSKDASILAAIAEAHINYGDARTAINLLQQAIERDKKNANLYYLLGNAYRKQNNGTEAYKAYKQALDYNSKFAAAHLAIAEIFLTQKNEEMYLQYFNEAEKADPNYAPVLERLYAYYFYKEPVKALQYFQKFSANADPDPAHAYNFVDLLYVSQNYNEAIQKANALIAEQGSNVKPRLYKLIGYSYMSQGDSAKALNYMTTYFAQEQDSNFLAKDFETMGTLYLSASKGDSAMIYLTKAAERDTAGKDYATYLKLAEFAEQQKDFATEAKWRAKYFANNERATNVDLFKWALAHYRAEDYETSSNVFTQYTEKYPDQSYGYYWLARANAARDQNMEQGLAVPHYEKLIEVLAADKENPNYKNWMVEAYAFLAAFKANHDKQYSEAKEYFEKVLEIDPENAEAKRYIPILEKAEAGK